MCIRDRLRGKLEGEINVLKEQINSARGNEKHLQNRKETLQREIDAKSGDKAAILTEKGKIDAHLKEVELARQEAKARLSEVQARIDELNTEIENGKNTIITELNERATIKSRMGRFDTMLEQIQIRRAELNSRLLRAKSDEAWQEENIKRLEEEFLQINENISALNDKQTLLEEELNQIRDEPVSYTHLDVYKRQASEQVPWASGSAWAPCIARKNGKYYFYFCAKDKSGSSCIGVAVAEPVSYTHLDVYKRQVPGQAWKKKFRETADGTYS